MEFSAERQCILMEHTELGTRFWVEPPFGPVGSKVLVPEMWFDVEKVKHAPLFQNETARFLYKRDGAFIGCHRWRSPATAPHGSVRLTLEVTGIYYQRLSDITDEQILREGVLRQASASGDGYVFIAPGIERRFETARAAYEAFWRKSFGAESRDLNPWILVTEFRVHSDLAPPLSTLPSKGVRLPPATPKRKERPRLRSNEVPF